jgi:hypothetical protein
MMISGAPASGKGTQCRLIVEKVKWGIDFCSPFVSADFSGAPNLILSGREI